MSWAGFISAGVGGWVRQGAASLGIGLVSYAGFTAIKVQVATAMSSALGGLPADVLAVLGLAGFGTAVGIWLGAMTTVASMMAFKRLGVMQA